MIWRMGLSVLAKAVSGVEPSVVVLLFQFFKAIRKIKIHISNSKVLRKD